MAWEDHARTVAKFEKRNPILGAPVGALFRYARGKSLIGIARMTLLPAIVFGNYFGLVDFKPYATLVLAAWAVACIGSVATLFHIKGLALEAHARGELKGDVAVHTQRYGEPDRIDIFTLLEHDLEELQKLLNTSSMIALATICVYAYSGNVTALVVQCVIIPLQIHGSALFQIYVMKERAVGPYTRPFKQITGANWMVRGDWVERVEKVDWKKVGRKGK